MIHHQYFSMPLTFLQECEDSAGMGQESAGMGLESTGIHRNETGFCRNYCIPTGIELESAGMILFLQEWNILNKIAYIYINTYISIFVFIDLLLFI